MNTVETGLQAGPPEKKTAKLADGMEEDTFSVPVCERESAELRRFVVNFRDNPGRFLCTADCMAEREGFNYLRFPQVMLKLTDSDITQCSCGFASTLFHPLESIPYTLFAPV